MKFESLPDICYRLWGYLGSPFVLHEYDGIKLIEIVKDFPPILVAYHIYITHYIVLQNVIIQYKTAN
jgi:hypothetical protein